MSIKVQCTAEPSICCQDAPARRMQCSHEIFVASLCRFLINRFMIMRVGDLQSLCKSY